MLNRGLIAYLFCSPYTDKRMEDRGLKKYMISNYPPGFRESDIEGFEEEVEANRLTSERD